MEVTAEHLALARQKKNLRQTIKAFNELAIIQTLQGKPDSALFYMEETIQIAEQLNDSVQIAILYMNHGNALCNTGRLREGISRYFESLYIFEKLNVKPLNQADINNNLGLVYLDLGLYEMAKIYLEKALHLYQQVKGPDAIGNIWLNLSQAHYHLDEFKEAKSNLQRAITILRRKPNLHSLSTAYLLSARIHEQESHLDSAQHYAQLAFEIRMEIGNVNQILEALVEKLNTSLRHHKKVTLEEKKKVVELLKGTTDLRIKAKGTHLLYKLYKLEENNAPALEMLELYTGYADSLNERRDRFTIIREEIQSDFDNKMLHRQLEEERNKAAADLKHLKNIFLLALGFLICILTIVELVRRRLKTNALEKAMLLREIEDLKRKGEGAQNQLVGTFELDKDKLERFLEKRLNETDWAVLNVLLENPVISNKELAERVFLSSDGVGSYLRRMYVMFDIAESKYMKIGLLLKAIKISNSL